MDPERPEIKGIFATITRRGSLTVPRRDQDTHTHTRTQVLNWPDLLQWFVFLLTEGDRFSKPIELDKKARLMADQYQRYSMFSCPRSRDAFIPERERMKSYWKF